MEVSRLLNQVRAASSSEKTTHSLPPLFQLLNVIKVKARSQIRTGKHVDGIKKDVQAMLVQALKSIQATVQRRVRSLKQEIAQMGDSLNHRLYALGKKGTCKKEVEISGQRSAYEENHWLTR